MKALVQTRSSGEIFRCSALCDRMSLSHDGLDVADPHFERDRDQSVLLVATHLSPGGVREMIGLIADELRLRGIDVAVAALYRGENADLRDLPCEIMINRDQPAASDYVMAFTRLAIRIRAKRPTAILSFMPAANILGNLAGSIIGVPTRVASHHQPASTQHPILRRIDLWLGKLGMYSHVVAVSASIRASLANYPPSYLKRVSVIPNSIRPIGPRSDPLAVRRHFGLRADRLLMVAIGRLTQEKNLFNTLAGISRVAGIQLALVGDGPLRPAIERYIAEMHLAGKVCLLGHVDRQVAADMLFAADVFVQLSNYEGRSLSLLEAICAEKTIVASDIPAQRDPLTMQDGSLAGLLCDPGDVDAIAAALSTIATNDKLRRDLAARTAVIKKDLDPMQMGRDYALLLRSRNSAAVRP